MRKISTDSASTRTVFRADLDLRGVLPQYLIALHDVADSTEDVGFMKQGTSLSDRRYFMRSHVVDCRLFCAWSLERNGFNTVAIMLTAR